MPQQSVPSSRNRIQPPSPNALAEAVAILQRGGLVALPTETVYGLGVDASNPNALKRLYTVKGRPGNHPVIVHIGSIEQLSDWAKEIPDAARQLADAFWPGPLTLILPRADNVLDAVTGGQDSVGIRIPNHPVALELLRHFKGGIAAPSANRFGRISPTTAEHVLSDLGDDVDLILDGGACPVGVESTIVSFQNNQPVILRPGMITAEQIETVLKRQTQNANQATAIPRVSGSLDSHYAPQTPVFLLRLDEISSRIASHPEQLIGVLAHSARPAALQTFANVRWVQMPDSATAYAQQLYAQLRHLDTQNLHAIVVEIVPTTSDWAAVSDRLQRAAFDASGK